MTSFDFSDSQYRFTSPVRYFKANDPIYYEVDNIPLKQLHENDLWLRDQIVNVKMSTEGGVERQNINELRPYVEGFDNVVKVKPGRFTARVNDAYNLTPLQIVSKLSFSGVNEYNTWEVAGLSAGTLSIILDRFRQSVALNLNGLAERAFAKVAYLPDAADTTYSRSTTPEISVILGPERAYSQPPYPGLGAVLWTNFNDSRDSSLTPTYYRVRQYDNQTINVGFARLGLAESAFIKKWRGIARTSVVDIPEELSIEIPAFNDQDHFYYNSAGDKIYTNATQRIDLVFIYSKPIDSSSTTIAKFVNGSPTTITRPQLGIVYGAGLGIDYKGSPEKKQVVLSPAGVSKGDFPGTDDTTLPDGTMKMLSHYGDETGANTGFNISGVLVKGSFPSPDDLMNIAPLLDETLNSNNISLIGQSVLPVAYVVVKKNSALNTDGSPILENNDLIDIRPFLRTTELTYNERAGLAAAIPAPSIVNPVVTQAELDYELKRVRDDVISRIPIIPEVEDPSYETIYISNEKTIFLSEPQLVFQKSNQGTEIGTYQNPREWSVGQEVFTSASPIRFAPLQGEISDTYKRYLKSVIVRADSATNQFRDSYPQAFYVGITPANAPVTQTPVWYKGSSSGGTRTREQVTTGGVNTMEIPVFSVDNSPPQLPLIIHSFGTNDNVGLPANSNYTAFTGPNGDYVNTFTLHIIGYKVVETVRFKTVLIPGDSIQG